MRTPVSSRDFAVCWAQSQTVDEVVRRLNEVSGRPISRKTVLKRAYYLRRMGVSVNKIIPSLDNDADIDVEGLNRVIEDNA